ncbi:MAG: hypothetical protein H6916_05620 [Novosphingobium sp.]|uniref:hypothetical protein n=1 Tax=Novosphingobium sp. TaxID=1874826 RepID=UPI00263507E4|nr:hypothetical protein [Novosphingobium sp.]MCP5386281.1 hypothetical protein [Novosphingobium sp.]HNJ46805.1 hypothetical protein [Novosphingobium sp.]HNN54979.1 hypothetical protein [Novosphingobium sp.]
MARSWQDKHDNHRHPTKVEVLEKPYAGLLPGQTIAIATPAQISAYFRSVPRGETRSMAQLRAHLARLQGADGACPMTTAIFSRIAAENAYERLLAGERHVAPFWRVIDPGSPLARKLACGMQFIRDRRAEEGC